MIEALFFGFISACITIFLNYTIGKPSSEFSPYEIFSNYTVWLSKRRLKQVGLLKQYTEQYNDNFLRLGLKCSSGECKNDNKLISLKNDFKKILYNAADPFFTWERAVGMCPVCTGFWISLIIGITVTFWIPLITGLTIVQNISGIIEIIVISHISIRIFNKIL